MKQEPLQVEGEVVEALPNTIFRVKLTGADRIIICHISGKMRKNNIRIIPGDKVLLEMSPYDLSKGRIIFRNK